MNKLYIARPRDWSINEEDVFQEKVVITEAKKLKQDKNHNLITIIKEDEYLVEEDLDKVFEELSRSKNHAVCLTEYPTILRTITVTSVDTINKNKKPNQKSIAEEFEREEDLKLIKTEIVEREKEVEIKKWGRKSLPEMNQITWIVSKNGIHIHRVNVAKELLMIIQGICKTISPKDQSQY
ncbi:hypothetical protein PPACK8108_LOCUS2920 [Phakopsora pachyrhizi]|uniref:Uncharacterized protein n=1 Tax=Phakopsora pachyrhizi TaxID=170000 RepID=A0AAV0AL30_PHAPC|nr:hypothetical protein PPACK8108_LOCUS2920 [Phakopsora pachyrhizi]